MIVAFFSLSLSPVQNYVEMYGWARFDRESENWFRQDPGFCDSARGEVAVISGPELRKSASRARLVADARAGQANRRRLHFHLIVRQKHLLLWRHRLWNAGDIYIQMVFHQGITRRLRFILLIEEIDGLGG